jgi:hypothetical protein
MRSNTAIHSTIIVALLLLLPAGRAFSQDLEPRRWTLLPPGMNVVATGYIKTDGDVFFDPVLAVEDADVDGHAIVVSDARSFKLAK